MIIKLNKAKMKEPKEEVCDITYIDEKKVASVKKRLKDDGTMQLLSETFKVLGDQTRIKIIYSLSIEELCVCDIANLLGTSKSAVSHQLRVLRNMRLVKYRKDGKKVFYSLDDSHINNLFAEGLKHIEEK